jgi:hypothetical protein
VGKSSKENKNNSAFDEDENYKLFVFYYRHKLKQTNQYTREFRKAAVIVFRFFSVHLHSILLIYFCLEEHVKMQGMIFLLSFFLLYIEALVHNNAQLLESIFRPSTYHFFSHKKKLRI